MEFNLAFKGLISSCFV